MDKAETIIAKHIASLCMVPSEQRLEVWAADAKALAEKLRKAGLLSA